MSDVNLVNRKDKRRSLAWKFFNRLDRVKAVCSICNKLLQTCGNTSNLINHLQKIHSINIESSQLIKKPQRKEEDLDESTPEEQHLSEENVFYPPNTKYMTIFFIKNFHILAVNTL